MRIRIHGGGPNKTQMKLKKLLSQSLIQGSESPNFDISTRPRPTRPPAPESSSTTITNTTRPPPTTTTTPRRPRTPTITLPRPPTCPRLCPHTPTRRPS